MEKWRLKAQAKESAHRFSFACAALGEGMPSVARSLLLLFLENKI